MSNFAPIKFLKEYSKQHPWRFYSILCVVSATAYGELKFRSMRRKELLVEKDEKVEAKNEYEQYLISQKKIKENQMSLDEERNRLKNIIDGTNNNSDISEEQKKTLLSNTKEKLNQLKNEVNERKEKLGNEVKIKNVKKGFSDGIEKLKNNSKNITKKISKEKISSKIRKNKSKKSVSEKSDTNTINPSVPEIHEQEKSEEKENSNLSFFRNSNERFRDYFQKFNNRMTSSSSNNYYGSTSRNDNEYSKEEEEIYENDNPERMIFLYDVTTQESNRNY